MDRQIYGQIDRQMDRQTDRWIDRSIDIQIDDTRLDDSNILSVIIFGPL